MLEPGAASRLDDVLGQAAEHHRDAVAARATARRAGGLKPLPPEALYVTRDGSGARRRSAA